MAGCGSCGGKNAGIQWQATWPDGKSQTYDTAGEAKAAINGVPGATYKAVAK